MSLAAVATAALLTALTASVAQGAMVGPARLVVASVGAVALLVAAVAAAVDVCSDLAVTDCPHDEETSHTHHATKEAEAA